MKIMNRSICKCLLSIIAMISLYDNIHAQTDLPKIVKPSPEASALFRFQDYPMDYSTGLPQISIPLYEVKSGSLTLPLSISYHASGRKVYDQDGPVALGWSLNAGGIISRTIYGAADFGTQSTGTYNFPYPFTVDNLSVYNDLAYLEKINHCTIYDCNIQPWTDSEYDIFSYSFGNYSGKFLFKDINGVKTPVLLPYQPFVVIPTYSANELTTIEITDDKGIHYQFSQKEMYSAGSHNATSSWSLTKIISADKTDEISLIYTGKSEERVTISQTATLIDAWAMESEPFPTDYLTNNESTSHESYQVSRLSEIDFKQGKVLFNLVAGTDKINNIQVSDGANNVLKTIQVNRSLCYSQAESGTTTNKMDALVFKDKSGNSVETYSFEYYPLVSSNGQLNARYCDWWGYYNNSGQHDFIPRYTGLQFVGSGGPGTMDVGNASANREPSLEPLKSGVLKKIIYPTGGYSEFIYEYNKCTQYGSVAPPRNGPGLRVYQISNADNNGTILTKTYKYGVSESGNGNIDLLPDMSTMMTQTSVGYLSGQAWVPMRSGKYRQRVFFSGFTSELSALAERPVVYTEVAEYSGTPAQNAGKTIYQYDYTPWGPSGMGGSPRLHIYNFNYWNNPSLVTKTEYKRNSTNANSLYQPVRATSNTYAVTVTENVRGLHVSRNISLPQTGLGGAIPPGGTTRVNVCSEKFAAYESSGNPFGAQAPIYVFNDYQIPAGFKNLTSSTETIYTGGTASITKTTWYTYNSMQLVSQTTTSGSDNLNIISQIKYPFDYTGDPLLTQMVSLNMLNYSIEQFELKDLSPRKSIRTNYFNWGTTPAHIWPKTIEAKNGTNPYEIRIRYATYDNDGNVQTVSKENDQLVSYLWGYNNSYPIAEITNAAVKNVFHTSFEDGTGNSTLNDSKTGLYSKTGGYSKSLTGLDNGNYILSYWQKSGATWNLQTSQVTVSAGTYTVSLTGQVDEVRFYPTSSQLKTFTYAPLIGILSQCDASDHTSYYEYDDYGRLKLIKDMNGNILKTFRYRYQSTTAN